MNFQKFLAIAFMCHRRPDRSFFFKGRQFPICARCTGILVGYFFGVTLACITGCKGYPYYLLLLLPMIIDGGIQQLFGRESNNIRRLITGIMGGIGVVYIFITIHMLTVKLDKAIIGYFMK